MPERDPRDTTKAAHRAMKWIIISENHQKYGTHRLTAEIKHRMEYLEYTAKSVGKQHALRAS